MDETAPQQQLVRERNRWLKGERAREVTTPQDFYLQIKRVKNAAQHSRDEPSLGAAIELFTAYVNLVPPEQIDLCNSRWRAGEKQLPFEAEYRLDTFIGNKQAFVRIIYSVTLLILGLYILHEGTSDRSAYADAIVVGGAVCLALSVLLLVFAGGSILSGRRMVRHTSGG
jgi:hypothetical protein